LCVCVLLLHLLGMGICQHHFSSFLSTSSLLFSSFPFQSALGIDMCGVGLVLAPPLRPSLCSTFFLQAGGAFLFSSQALWYRYALQASVWSGLVRFRQVGFDCVVRLFNTLVRRTYLWTRFLSVDVFKFFVEGEIGGWC
jgi:hypothetical protein